MNEFILNTLLYLKSSIKGEGGDGCGTLVSRTFPISEIAKIIEDQKLDHFWSAKLDCWVKVWEREDHPNMILFSDRRDENLLLIQGIENFNMAEVLYDNVTVII
jgi:hypothetical protein